MIMTKDKQKPKKTVFTIINLATNKKNQLAVAKYAAHLASELNLDVVLYPKENHNLLFSNTKKNHRKILDISRTIEHIVSVRTAKKESTLFSSIHDIATQEEADFIVIEVDKSVNVLGESMWKTTQGSRIPIILLPQNYEFVPFDRITIAVDRERKVQKIRVVTNLAKKFGSMVNIFIEKFEKQDNQVGEIILAQIEKSLRKSSIPFKETHVRKDTKFLTRLCKFSAKHSDLLVIEVEPGKIDSVIKKNIETLLAIQNYAQPIPVILTKTKMSGHLQSFS